MVAIWYECFFSLTMVITAVSSSHNPSLFLSIVKLHSDLRILTQLQLVGVGVDFVFPLEEEEEEELTPT